MVAGVIGGAASVIGGGKFANGAVRAALAYAVNQSLSNKEIRKQVALLKSTTAELSKMTKVAPNEIKIVTGALSVAIRLHATKGLLVANMTPEERVFIARAFGHDSLISTLEADIPGMTGTAVGLLGSEIRKDYIFTQWKDISQVGIGATKMFVERVLVGMGVSNNAVNLYGAIDNTIGASDQ
ncbi:hypothetical protein [Neptuniibacter pectenicola]|uniref:hypothetical protein n=1 Tax=Neptuniibacter pectenicola TaxID=1806669 RepID=UPI00082DC132|nr:hypothetical protein [Neptuniibacter pectenicola]